MSPLLMGAIVIAVIGVGAFALWSNNRSSGAAAASATTAAKPGAKGDEPTAASIEAARVAAAFGPRKQANLPPIPFQGYAPPRSPEVVTAAYVFAAEHPEVASYVPCFCGCQAMGHTGNEDCFVSARAASGDVIAWEPHGVECAVCIDVATRSRQMTASGASVTATRAAIEKEFAATSPVMTPTPKPPSALPTAAPSN